MAPKNTPQAIDPSVFANDDQAVEMPSSGFSIDFSSVPTEEELIPIGKYAATIANAEAAVSKAGNPMIKLRWKISDGDYAGRTVFDQLVFITPTGDWNADYPLRKIKGFLLAIGYAQDFKGDLNSENLIGESCVIKVKVDAGKGINPETQARYADKNAVAAYEPAGSRRKVDDLL